MLAGANAILKKANVHFENNESLKVLHLTDIILKAEPNNKAANELRLKTLEKLKSGTYNYIERIWLDYGIKLAKEKLEN